jgi:hypothetical protein
MSSVFLYILRCRNGSGHNEGDDLPMWSPESGLETSRWSVPRIVAMRGGLSGRIIKERTAEQPVGGLKAERAKRLGDLNTPESFHFSLISWSPRLWAFEVAKVESNQTRH